MQVFCLFLFLLRSPLSSPSIRFPTRRVTLSLLATRWFSQSFLIPVEKLYQHSTRLNIIHSSHTPVVQFDLHEAVVNAGRGIPVFDYKELQVRCPPVNSNYKVWHSCAWSNATWFELPVYMFELLIYKILLSWSFFKQVNYMVLEVFENTYLLLCIWI